MGIFNLFKPAQTVLVVDILALNESLGMKGKVPPRNQLQVLRRLARFSQREKIKVVAVLAGSPLNKAPGGKKFEDVLVLYSKSIEKHAAFLAKTVRAKGARGVLVSGNASVEKVAAKSAKKMHVSTFRKAFDMGGDPEGMERGENGRSRGNNRPPRRRQSKPSGNNNNAQKQERQPKPERQPKKERQPAPEKQQKQERPPKKLNSDADAINELIDLVD